VFEHEGRYWVLDYKSNALGGSDAAYHTAALVAAMAEHRYDIQGAIYMLALHRLLQSRLGARLRCGAPSGRYAIPVPARDRNEHTRGCYLITPIPACSMAWTDCWRRPLRAG
jgi:exodeoxyribonuclease V beta subunit